MMSSIIISMSNKTCQRCGYEWEARKLVPRSCPACHSYKWNIAREVNRKDGDHLNNSVDNLEIQERVIVPIEET
jgi:Zn finger protein HypA/HybF involved in hydrogenase expression